MAIRPDLQMLNDGTVAISKKKPAKGQPIIDVLGTVPTVSTVSTSVGAKGQPSADVFGRTAMPTNPETFTGPTVPTSSTGGTGTGTITTTSGTYPTYTGNIANNFTPTPQDNTKRQSAYDLLYEQFRQYGLESLVEPLRGLITDTGVSPSEFTIRLRDTDQYKKRFAANQSRIQKGLTALSEAEYLNIEDAYQNIMRNYGLPASYYAKGDLGRQEGFEKLIANDVSATELEDRVAMAQQRVLNANPEVMQAFKKFYPDISNADILAYTLDPENALTNIKRKITAAEIGGAAFAQGLESSAARAEELAGYGVTKEQAQQGYQDVAQLAPRGGQLAAIYRQEPYTQTTAEEEVFGTAGAAEAAKKRKKLTSLEQASFAGSSGVAQNAITRDRAAGLI